MSAPSKQLSRDEWLAAMRAARDKLSEVQAMRCECSGFCLQYEGGCQCARGKAITAAEAAIADLLEAL